VTGLSVPYRSRGSTRPDRDAADGGCDVLPAPFSAAGHAAEAGTERDPRSTLLQVLYGGSGDASRGVRVAGASDVGMVPRAGGFLRGREMPATLPKWLTEADLDFYAGEFKRSGFRGGLNWYRNIDRNWEIFAPWAGAKVTVPALYMAGDRDLVVAFRGMDKLLPALKQIIPQLRETIILPGCGHWTQQERPAEVNAAMIAFLKTLS
jgi:pimeloyl-ACP methyl ester carboxylesterase